MLDSGMFNVSYEVVIEVERSRKMEAERFTSGTWGSIAMAD